MEEEEQEQVVVTQKRQWKRKGVEDESEEEEEEEKEGQEEEEEEQAAAEEEKDKVGRTEHGPGTTLNGQNALNLDVTTLIAYCSDLCNRGNEPDTAYRHYYQHAPKIVCWQLEQDFESPVVAQLQAWFAGRTLIVCHTALTKFKDIIATVGGPREQQICKSLLARLHVVADQPSRQVQRLLGAHKKVKQNVIIFGTGDYYRCPTATANSHFLQQAQKMAQKMGVNFPVLLHGARALTERLRIPTTIWHNQAAKQKLAANKDKRHDKECSTPAKRLRVEKQANEQLQAEQGSGHVVQGKSPSFAVHGANGDFVRDFSPLVGDVGHEFQAGESVWRPSRSVGHRPNRLEPHLSFQGEKGVQACMGGSAQQKSKNGSCANETTHLLAITGSNDKRIRSQGGNTIPCYGATDRPDVETETPGKRHNPPDGVHNCKRVSSEKTEVQWQVAEQGHTGATTETCSWFNAVRGRYELRTWLTHAPSYT
eukprot:g9729.t1